MKNFLSIFSAIIVSFYTYYLAKPIDWQTWPPADDAITVVFLGCFALFLFSIPLIGKGKKTKKFIAVCSLQLSQSLVKDGIKRSSLFCPSASGQNITFIADTVDDYAVALFDGNQDSEGQMGLDELQIAQAAKEKGANVIVRFDPNQFSEGSVDRSKATAMLISLYGLSSMTTTALVEYLKKQGY